MQKYSAEESALLDAIKAGEFKSVDNLKEELAKAKQAANNTMTQNKVGGVMMKYIIACFFLFTISLFASDNNVSGQQIIKKNITLPKTNYFYHVIKGIKNNYVNENQSEEISLELKKNMFDWYLTQCDHNDSATPENIDIQWPLFAQSCAALNEKNIIKLLQDNLSKYDIKILDMNILKETTEDTGIILTNNNGKLTVIDTLDQSSAQKNKIPIGSVITFINDQPTQNICLDDAIKKLKGSIGSSITITTDQNISYTLTRDRIAFISHLKIGSDLLVIKIYMFDQYIPNRIKTILEQYPQNMNIILDIRNNKGGLVNSIEETLSLFTQPNTELFSLTNRSFKKYDTFKIVSTNPMKTVPKPVYIIINHTTASGALLFAKTMQRENAIVIGTSKETVSSSYRVITFSENNALKLPVGKFYFPDGTVASDTTVKSDIPLDTDSLDDEALYEKIATIIKNR